MSGTILLKDRHGRLLRRPTPIIGHRQFRRIWRAVTRTLKAYAEGVAEARRMARVYDELASMSEPQLHDIGISRADIPEVVAGTYRIDRRVVSRPVSAGRREWSPSSDRRDQPCDQGASS